MLFPTFMSWLCTAAMFALLLCSLLLVFKPQYSPLLRFGPLAVVGAYLGAALIHFYVEGVAAVLLIPVGCFGLFLGVRILSRRSALSYAFAVSSFVFWPAALFVFSRYLVLTHLHR